MTKHGLHRFRKVRVFDLSDPKYTIGLNLFLSSSLQRGDEGFEPATLAEMMIKSFLRVWGQDNAKDTPLIYEILLNLFCSLIHCNLTLLDSPIFLDVADRNGKRAYFLTQLPDEYRTYWEELHSLPATDVINYLAPVKRRLMGFLKAPSTHRMFGCTDPKRNLDLARAMDRGELIVFTAKPGRALAQAHAQLFGALLMSGIYMAGFQRKRPDIPCMAIIDEAASVMTPDMAFILEECRKFGISLTIAVQHLEQLREAGDRAFSAVMANTHIKTCLGGLPPRDAELMAETMFWGDFDLQTFKPRLKKMQVVGQKKVRLHSLSETRGTNQGTSTNWSRGTSVSNGTTVTDGTSRTVGESETEGQSKTSGKSFTYGHSHIDSRSTTRTETDGWSESESESETETSGNNTSWNDTRGRSFDYAGGLFPEASHTSESRGSGGGSSDSRSIGRGTSRTQARSTSVAKTDGQSDTTSFSETDSLSETISESTTKSRSTTNSHALARSHQMAHSSSVGGGTSEGTSHAQTKGHSEGFSPIYEAQGTETWSRDELIHKRAVSLANLPQDQLIVGVGSRRPIRASIPYVRDVDVAPGSDMRMYQRLLHQTLWVWDADEANRARAEAVQLLEALAREGLEESRPKDMPRSTKDRFE